LDNFDVQPASGGILGGKYPASAEPGGAQPTPVRDVFDLHRIMQGINDNAATLMALGGGMMTGGVGRGFQAAAAASEHDRKHQKENVREDATLRALLQAGVPATTAQAAVGNPVVLKAVSGHAFGQAPETIKVRLAGGEDALLLGSGREAIFAG